MTDDGIVNIIPTTTDEDGDGSDAWGKTNHIDQEDRI
jgi:hypothetical protein